MRSLGKNRFNRKGLRAGYWEEYYANGNIWCKGRYINGMKDGIWEYYYDGEIYDTMNY